MQSSTTDLFIQLFPLFLVQCLLLFAVVPLATKSSKRAWASIVFALVPVIGGFAFPLLMGNAVAAMLSRIDALSAKLDAKP